MKRIAGCIFLSTLLLIAPGTSAPQDAKSENAPRLSPNVTEEMLHPQFWIANLKGDPDRVILAPAQISELNRVNRAKSYEFTDINGKKYNLLGRNSYLTDDPLSITSIPGDSVRAIMEQRLTAFERGASYDFRKKRLDAADKRKIIEKTRHTEIPKVIIPRYGILVCPSQNMKYPTSEEFWPSPESWISNNSFSSLDAASPVAALHTSEDGDWYYVRVAQEDEETGWSSPVWVNVG